MSANHSLVMTQIKRLLLLALSLALMIAPSAIQAAVNKIYYQYLRQLRRIDSLWSRVNAAQSRDLVIDVAQ